MNLNRGRKNIKEVYTLQFIILRLMAIVLMVIPLFLGFMLDFIQFVPKSYADGVGLMFLVMIAFVSICTVIPVGGVIVAILSTIAYSFNKENKRKVAGVLNVICIVIFVMISFIFMLCQMPLIAMFLWSIIVFNIYLTGKSKSLQKSQELIEQNIYEENINSES